MNIITRALLIGGIAMVASANCNNVEEVKKELLAVAANMRFKLEQFSETYRTWYKLLDDVTDAKTRLSNFLESLGSDKEREEALQELGPIIAGMSRDTDRYLKRLQYTEKLIERRDVVGGGYSEVPRSVR